MRKGRKEGRKEERGEESREEQGRRGGSLVYCDAQKRTSACFVSHSILRIGIG